MLDLLLDLSSNFLHESSSLLAKLLSSALVSLLSLRSPSMSLPWRDRGDEMGEGGGESTSKCSSSLQSSSSPRVVCINTEFPPFKQILSLKLVGWLSEPVGEDVMCVFLRSRYCSSGIAAVG